MTKVDIISGFLGAGKTTFIKQLIQDVFSGEKIVLIENEFGEIGIDGGFLKDAGIEITEMNSGCICCTLVGDFSSALQKVVEEYHPDRIIIEPSGVGKLSDVAKAVEAVKGHTEIELNSRITVVDCKKAKIYMKNFGEFFNDQITNATTIVLSRTQMMSDVKLEECVKLVREKNQSATLITTPWYQLDGNVIARAIDHSYGAEELLAEEHGHHHGHEEGCGCGHHHGHEESCGCSGHHHDHEESCGCGGHHHDHEESCGCGGHHHDHEESCGEHHHDHEESCGEHHHDHDGGCGCGHHHGHEGHHHADEVFTSWGRETAHRYDKTDLEQFLKGLAESKEYGTVLRAKGIVSGTDGKWIEFDLVPGEYEIREGNPDYTGKICVIGTDLKTERLADRLHLQA